MKERFLIAAAFLLVLAVGMTASWHSLEETVNIPISANTSTFVSLPYTCSYTTAQLLRNGIVLAGGEGVNVYNWNGAAWQRYAGGGIGQVNFSITPGLGYMVKTTNDVTAWSVTGTHNPSVSVAMAANVQKIVSVPYSSPSITASLLRNEIVAAGGTGVSVYNWDGTAWQRWSGGGIGQLDFYINPGTGYVVKSTAAVPAWFPASN